MSDYRALYRKWRPRDFDDVCGQNAITDILKYQVAVGKLSHAYLFCGSRGTGKTSCAKILAKAVNCLDPQGGNPCGKCEACRSIDAGTATDVIEMDAASNNGVDNVRDMKDEIAFTPAVLKYRVYVIDEVHMMSSSAFNALLKTLEEPPNYVVFILATTEFHKLPNTIVSRCQRFDFRRISSDVIISRLDRIAKAEGIELDPDGARVIARVSRGGMRDAVSLLELCAGARRKIDAPLVFETVGSGNRDSAYKLISSIVKRDYGAVYSTVNDVVMSSGDVSVFWQELIDSYRDIMVVKNTDKAREYLDLTELEYAELSSIAGQLTPAALAYHVTILEGAMADMQRAFNSKRSIAEIALTRMCDSKSHASYEALADRVEALERELSMIKLGVPTQPQREQREVEPKVTSPVEEQKNDPAPELAKSSEPSKAQNDAVSDQPTSFNAWTDVVERIGELKTSLSVQFLKSKALKQGNTFYIMMNPFFAGRLASNEEDIAIVRGVIAERTGIPSQDVKIVVKSQSTSVSAASELERALGQEEF